MLTSRLRKRSGRSGALPGSVSRPDVKASDGSRKIEAGGGAGIAKGSGVASHAWNPQMSLLLSLRGSLRCLEADVRIPHCATIGFLDRPLRDTGFEWSMPWKGGVGKSRRFPVERMRLRASGLDTSTA